MKIQIVVMDVLKDASVQVDKFFPREIVLWLLNVRVCTCVYYVVYYGTVQMQHHLARV